MSVKIYDELIGHTLIDIEVLKNTDKGDVIKFVGSGFTYIMWHDQQCCENVTIKEIVGDLKDLIGSPLVQAEEVVKKGKSSDDMSDTWTFYKFATIKGYVTITWYGEFNGYYSEEVDFGDIEYSWWC